jgi:hypothetical protein
VPLKAELKELEKTKFCRMFRMHSGGRLEIFCIKAYLDFRVRQFVFNQDIKHLFQCHSHGICKYFYLR